LYHRAFNIGIGKVGSLHKGADVVKKVVVALRFTNRLDIAMEQRIASGGYGEMYVLGVARPTLGDETEGGIQPITAG
jgi:hypothetical protein